jgi:hypothetical protein
MQYVFVRIGLGGTPDSLFVADYLKVVGDESPRPKLSSDSLPDASFNNTSVTRLNGIEARCMQCGQ